MSIARTPFGWGDAIVFTGAPVYVSHTTSTEPGPRSAVAAHRRSADAHVHEIGLTWPWSSRCVFDVRSYSTPVCADAYSTAERLASHRFWSATSREKPKTHLRDIAAPSDDGPAAGAGAPPVGASSGIGRVAQERSSDAKHNSQARNGRRLATRIRDRARLASCLGSSLSPR